MPGKKKLVFTLLILISFPISAFADAFTTADLAGTWYGHHVVTGDAPADDPRWGYGTAVIDNSGNYTSTWTSPTQTNEVTTGTIQITATGIITIDNQSLTHGVMNTDKNLIVFIDGTQQSRGNALTVMIKRGAGVSFSTANLAGTWYGHHVVSGDAPANEPRWGYGSAVISPTGAYTATWTSPTQTNEVTTGTIQITGNGIIKIDNHNLTHGVMNDAGNLIVFIDGTPQSKGNAMTIMLKRGGANNFTTADPAGTWSGHHVVSGDFDPTHASDEPRWGYGTVVIDNAGNYTSSWNSPTQTNEINSGNLQVAGNGTFTIDNQNLTHGVISDDRELIVFIDGTPESKGNALTVLVKSTSIVQSGPNLLLLNGGGTPIR